MGPFLLVFLACLGLSESLERLPTVQPISYKLTFVLDPISINGTNSFDGEAIIRFKPKVFTNTLVLHSKGLWARNISVWSPFNGEVYDSHTFSNDDSDFLRVNLTFKTNVELDKEFEIRISYTGFYGVSDGIYRSSYVESSARRWLIATNFAPSSARKAFPCFDEPGYKAKYSLEVHAPQGFHVNFHTDRQSINASTIPGYNVTTFTNSTPISTYQLGFVVSSFSEKSTAIDGRKISISSRYDVINYFDYPLTFSRVSLLGLENYLNVKYPMSKLDYVALPDAMFDTMESFGTTMYKEESLVHIDSEISSAMEQKINTMICHQNAHHWFGNLVTPSWWEFMWLNDGFATYFENLIIDQTLSGGSWRQVEQFVAGPMQDALHLDSLMYPRPMSAYLITASDTLANYDFSSNSKAASVIRMMHHVLGEQVFREGIRNYLGNNTQNAVEPGDLYKALQEAAKGKIVLPRSVDIIFDSWASQSAYPLVYAQRDDSNIVFINQERYFLNKNKTSEKKWWIPLRIVTSSNITADTSPQDWLGTEQNKNYTINDSWFYLNPYQTGYYRVMYDHENWKQLTNFLRSDDFRSIPPLNRAQLLDDAFAFARSGRLPYETALNLALYLESEDDLIPWISARRFLNYLDVQFSYTAFPVHYKNFKQLLVKKIYNSVGIDYPQDEGMIKRLTRNLAVDVAYNSYMDETWAKIDEYTKEIFLTSGSKLHPDLKELVYCHALKYGQTSYEYLWEKYLNSNQSTEKTILLKSLPCTPDTTLKEELLMKSIENSYDIRNHDRSALVIGVIKSNDNGLLAGLKFLNENYFKLQEKCQSPKAMGEILEALADTITRDEDMLDFMLIHELHRRNYSTSEMIASERAIEILYDNKRWRNEGAKEIDIWLKDNINSANAKHISLFSMLVCLILIWASSLTNRISSVITM